MWLPLCYIHFQTSPVHLEKEHFLFLSEPAVSCHLTLGGWQWIVQGMLIFPFEIMIALVSQCDLWNLHTSHNSICDKKLLLLRVAV